MSDNLVGNHSVDKVNPLEMPPVEFNLELIEVNLDRFIESST